MVDPPKRTFASQILETFRTSSSPIEIWGPTNPSTPFPSFSLHNIPCNIACTMQASCRQGNFVTCGIRSTKQRVCRHPEHENSAQLGSAQPSPAQPTVISLRAGRRTVRDVRIKSGGSTRIARMIVGQQLPLNETRSTTIPTYLQALFYWPAQQHNWQACENPEGFTEYLESVILVRVNNTRMLGHGELS